MREVRVFQVRVDGPGRDGCCDVCEGRDGEGYSENGLKEVGGQSCAWRIGKQLISSGKWHEAEPRFTTFGWFFLVQHSENTGRETKQECCTTPSFPQYPRRGSACGAQHNAVLLLESRHSYDLHKSLDRENAFQGAIPETPRIAVLMN